MTLANPSPPIQKELPKEQVVSHPLQTTFISSGCLIAGIYEVEAGPLTPSHSKANVYRCRNKQTGEAVAVKLRQDTLKAEAKKCVTRLLSLSHPHILPLQSYGEWEDYFYTVTPFCEGGGWKNQTIFTAQTLLTYLPYIISALDYSHKQGIIHNNIKPSNLFFRQQGQHEVLVGDFGISHFMHMHTASIRTIQSITHFTVEYAAPEILEGHRLTDKVDYYALGITLLHLLAGGSPFKGKAPNDILIAHLCGRLPIHDDLPLDFKQLIIGLTYPTPIKRWGYKQVISWLNHQTIYDDTGKEWDKNSAILPLQQVYPYPGYPKAKTPVQLARCLDKFPATRQLFRGDIRHWVADHFDKKMAQKIEALEENYTNRQSLGLIKLKYILDTHAPLTLGKHTVHNLQSLALILLKLDKAEQRQFLQLFWEGSLSYWIKVTQQSRHKAIILHKIKGIQKRLQHNPHSKIIIYALLYTITPHAPLYLTQKLKIETPQALTTLLTRFEPKRLIALFQECISSHHWDEWLIAREFPHWHKDIKFINAIRRYYHDSPNIATYAIFWYYVPQFPFPLEDEKISTLKQLAAYIDKNNINHQKGLLLLEQQWIQAWLLGLQHIQSPIALEELFLQHEVTNAVKLETILHILDPELPQPIMQVSPEKLACGQILLEIPKNVMIEINNIGRGYLHGEVKVVGDNNGVQLHQHYIEGNKIALHLTIDATGLLENTSYCTVVYIDTNGGTIQCPIQYSVCSFTGGQLWQWWEQLKNTALWKMGQKIKYLLPK